MSKKIAVFIYCGLILGLTTCAPPPEIEQELPSKPEIGEAKKHYSFCMEYLKNRMYDDAVKNCEQAVAESTGYIDAYVALGLAYRGKGEYGEMERVYKALVEFDPLKGHYALGHLYTEEGQFDKALDNYNAALKVDSTYADAWYGIGYVYEIRPDFDFAIAIENYKHALQFDPENKSIRFSLAKLYVEVGEYENAIEILTALSEKHSEDIDVRESLGRAYLAVKRHQKAKAEFEYIAEKSPTDISNLISLGLSCEGLRDYECAITAYKDAIAVDATNISTYHYLITLFISLKRFGDADTYLSRVKAISPENPFVINLSGDIYLERGNIEFRKGKEASDEGNRSSAKKHLESALSYYKKAQSIYGSILSSGEPTCCEYAKKCLGLLETRIKETEELLWWNR